VIDMLSDVALLGMIFDRCAEYCEGDAGLWRTSLRHSGDVDAIPGTDICAAVIEGWRHLSFPIRSWLDLRHACKSFHVWVCRNYFCLPFTSSIPASSFRALFPRGDTYSPCRQISDYFALNFVPIDLFLAGKVDVRPRRHALSTLFLQRWGLTGSVNIWITMARIDAPLLFHLSITFIIFDTPQLV
jgi:hypothetical protein